MSKSRAEVFAQRFHCADGNVMHVYEDGVILIRACDKRQHAITVGLLTAIWPTLETARLPDEFGSLFVLPGSYPLGEVEPHEIGDGFLVGLCEGFADHREEDHYRLDLVADLFRRCGDRPADPIRFGPLEPPSV